MKLRRPLRLLAMAIGVPPLIAVLALSTYVPVVSLGLVHLFYGG